MGRLYLVTTGFQTVSALSDLIELKAGSSNPIILHFLTISQSSDYGDAEAEGLEVTIKRAAGSFTSGSGGGSLTVNPYQYDGTVADSFATEERNNTTQASAGSGSLETIWQEGFNIQAGWQFYPAPEHRPFFNSSQALIVSLTAPADGLTLCASALIEELG